MEQYWEQVVQALLGPRNTSKLKLWSNNLNDEKVADQDSTENVVKEEVKDQQKRSRNKKKFKGGDSSSIDVASQSLKNLSLTSDEGIDISYNSLSAPVTSIPKEILRPQHHLSTSWTFWYSVGDKNLSWVQNQIKLCTVSTIEQFWYVTSQLQPPSNITMGHTYSVFRAGVLPDWEDSANISGGRWMIPCPKSERQDKLDKRWLEILFMMVGDHMEGFSGLVNGAEACVRKKGDRVEVWVKDAGQMMGVVEVGRRMKTKLGLDAKMQIKFSLHKEDKEGVKGPRLGL